mgnify:CR=1 FL=1
MSDATRLTGLLIRMAELANRWDRVATRGEEGRSHAAEFAAVLRYEVMQALGEADR